MRIWINRGYNILIMWGEVFPPGEWKHFDASFGDSIHPDIVEAWVYVLDLAMKAGTGQAMKEQGIDSMIDAILLHNTEYGQNWDIADVFTGLKAICDAV